MENNEICNWRDRLEASGTRYEPTYVCMYQRANHTRHGQRLSHIYQKRFKSRLQVYTVVQERPLPFWITAQCRLVDDVSEKPTDPTFKRLKHS